MMPLLMDHDNLWRHLEKLEHEHRPEAGRRPGYSYYDDFDDQEARRGRVHRVRGALFFSSMEAGRILGERLAGIDLSAVLSILLNACKDVAVYWGGSVLAGGALGGAIGAFGGGVGALPGAAIGAGLGSQVGAWVLGILGLKALLADLGTALPEALHHYERGIRLAWGPVRHWENSDTVFMDQDRASREIAKGHVVLIMAVLMALSAYLTRGRGDPAARARMLQEIRTSRRLGPKVADWVAANEEALARHPGLKPKEQQVVMMSQAKPPAGPPMTPSQLRKAAAEVEDPGGGTAPRNAAPKTPAPWTGKSIFSIYPEKTTLRLSGAAEQAKFLAENVPRLSETQAKMILDKAYARNSSVVVGGSRIRGDFVVGSDIDVGFGNLNANQAGKLIDGLNKHFSQDPNMLMLERTRITPGNSTPTITEPIVSPEEFFQRSGMRIPPDPKAGQLFVPSGSITMKPDGTVVIIPPGALR